MAVHIGTNIKIGERRCKCYRLQLFGRFYVFTLLKSTVFSSFYKNGRFIVFCSL